MMGQPNLCIHVFIRHHTVRLYVHTVHTIWRKQTDTGKTVAFLLLSLLNNFFARETKKAFWVHLSAYFYDNYGFVSFFLDRRKTS